MISDDPMEVQQSKSIMRPAGLLGAEGTSHAAKCSRASPQTLLTEILMRFPAPKSYPWQLETALINRTDPLRKAKVTSWKKTPKSESVQMGLIGGTKLQFQSSGRYHPTSKVKAAV